MRSSTHSDLWRTIEAAILDGQHVIDIGGSGSDEGMVGRIRKVAESASGLGAVVQLTQGPDRRATARTALGFGCTDQWRYPAKLVGSSVRWSGMVDAFAASLTSPAPLLLAGPAGSGKTALAAAGASALLDDPAAFSVVIASDALSTAQMMPETGVRLVILDDLSMDDHATKTLPRIYPCGVGGRSQGCGDGHHRTSGSRPRDWPTVRAGHRSTESGPPRRRYVRACQVVGLRSPPSGAGNAEAIREIEARIWSANVRELFESLEAAAAGTIGPIVRAERRPRPSGRRRDGD